MVIPLKNKLEDRLTPLRFLRSKGAFFHYVMFSDFSHEIRIAFDGKPKRVRQKKTPLSNSTYVSCYPPEFLPTIEKIYQSFLGDGYEKLLEKRIKIRKQRHFLKKKKIH
jgi:hypothetical protein